VSKISELSDGGSLVSSDYLIAVRSGGNVKVRMDQINVDQVDLGDNEFIRLGNSQDLTMVHTSTQSIINQAGIGDLLIQKAGATKLTINASGIDVTGSVTADGLSVDGDITVNDATPSLTLSDTGGTDQKFVVSHNGATSYLTFRNNTNYGALQFIADNGTTTALRQSISSNGDINLGYEDTGTTPKLVWDASAESLGIGTDSPSAAFNTVSDTIWFQNAARSYGIGIYADDANSSTKIRQINSGGSVSINTGSGGANQTTFDSSGNVGIGESSPAEKLEVAGNILLNASNAEVNLRSGVAGTSGAINWTFNTDTTDFASIKLAYDDRNTTGLHIDSGYPITLDASGIGTIFAQSGIEKARINSSGYLLVGTTDSTPYNNSGTGNGGAGIQGDGLISSAREDFPPAIFNRLVSDGSIVEFRKDGSGPAGIIGTESNRLTIGTDDTGLIFSSLNYIRPWNPTANIAADTDINLGGPNDRFKNLYLSDGVYLGGNGAANKLEDYEEGTWTPLLTAVSGTKTWTYSAQRGTYTKVGNLVTVFFNIQLTSNGSGTNGAARITGLPFLSATDSALVAYYAFFWKQLINTTDVSLMGQMPAGGDYITFLDGSSSYPDISYIDTSLFVNDRRVRGSIQYRV